MEPLELEDRELEQPEKPWAVKGTPETRKNLLCSMFLEPNDLEAHQRKMQAKYEQARQEEPRYEAYQAEDAELLLVGYGIVSRILHSVVEEARREGLRVGLFRPLTLWPFPAQALRNAAARVQKVLVFELSHGQMVEDVRLALNGKVPVEFHGRSGGNVPTVEEAREIVVRQSGKPRLVFAA